MNKKIESGRKLNYIMLLVIVVICQKESKYFNELKDKIYFFMILYIPSKL